MQLPQGLSGFISSCCTATVRVVIAGVMAMCENLSAVMSYSNGADTEYDKGELDFPNIGIFSVKEALPFLWWSINIRLLLLI